ncbi:MAG: recombinase family protein [Lachnospiraceae bacterium]|nr:recombinase family protein [Lachnospiraceae bacterium]
MYAYELNSDFQKRDVAIYARVSTEHEAQLSALENQMDWYKPILTARPDWTLVAQYVDEGITGTSAEKRPQFMKMIEDAKKKKFNMIITREVSRFARNTVDTLQFTRKLKEYGVEVFFINDNIKTFDGDGELRLTIMATLAQDESRKTSLRVKAGQQTSMENGVLYGNGNILGYDRVGKDLVINPEQAKTVRMIFDMYLSGMGVTKIQYELEKEGRLTSMGKTKWFPAYISKMLKNSFYCGIITYHKEYTPDYLKQQKIKNNGVLEYVKVKGNHTPIITEEEYKQVIEMMNRKTKSISDTKKSGQKPQGTLWGKLLICQCGKKFNQHFHARKGRHSGVYYQCYTSVNLGSYNERIKRGLSIDGACDSPFIPDWKLDMMAKYIFSGYIENIESTINLAYTMLEKHIADQEEIPDNTDIIRCKQEEIEKYNRKKANLFEMREDGDIDSKHFKIRKAEIEAKLESLTDEIEKLTPKKVEQSTEDFEAALKMLKNKLQQVAKCDGSQIPESVVEAFIEKIWVAKNEFRWYLRVSDTMNESKDRERMKIAEFKITFEEAKKYLYSFSTKRRLYNWVDLNVSIWM